MSEHAKQRAFERYGINLTDADIRKIIHDIVNGAACLVKKLSDRETIYLIKFEGTAMKALYHTNGAIKTFLPRHADKRRTTIPRNDTAVINGKRRKKRNGRPVDPDYE